MNRKSRCPVPTAILLDYLCRLWGQMHLPYRRRTSRCRSARIRSLPRLYYPSGIVIFPFLFFSFFFFSFFSFLCISFLFFSFLFFSFLFFSFLFFSFLLYRNTSCPIQCLSKVLTITTTNLRRGKEGE